MQIISASKPSWTVCAERCTWHRKKAQRISADMQKCCLHWPNVFECKHEKLLIHAMQKFCVTMYLAAWPDMWDESTHVSTFRMNWISIIIADVKFANKKNLLNFSYNEIKQKPTTIAQRKRCINYYTIRTFSRFNEIEGLQWWIEVICPFDYDFRNGIDVSMFI